MKKLLITIILCASLCGCNGFSIKVPREGEELVEISSLRAFWDTSANDVSVYIDDDQVDIQVGRIDSVSDANSIEALSGGIVDKIMDRITVIK